MTNRNNLIELTEILADNSSSRAQYSKQKLNKTANLLGTTPSKVGKYYILIWTLITVLCHLLISVMIFFPAYEYLFSIYFVDKLRAFDWSFWFITAPVPIMAIVFILISLSSRFKPIQLHASNVQRGWFYAYWAATIIAYAIITVRSGIVYDKYSGLGAPDTWVNFYAIRSYNMIGRDCLVFFCLLQVLLFIYVFNWANVYKHTLWYFFNIYELKEDIEEFNGKKLEADSDWWSMKTIKTLLGI